MDILRNYGVYTTINSRAKLTMKALVEIVRKQNI